MGNKPHTQFKNASNRALNGRKHKNKCEKCNKICCDEHLYKYTDDTNASINYGSPYLCKICYSKTYNHEFKTENQTLLKKIINDYYYIKNNIKEFDFNNEDKFYLFIQKYYNEE